jgi:hypothetical protein
MAINGPAEQIEYAVSILDQLLEYTKQIAASGSDPQVDVIALSRACGKRLEELKKVLPERSLDLPETGKAEDGASSSLSKMIAELYANTQVCTEILQKELVKTEAELQSISKIKRAISAYNS